MIGGGDSGGDGGSGDDEGDDGGGGAGGGIDSGGGRSRISVAFDASQKAHARHLQRWQWWMRNFAAQKPWHCAVAVSAANWDAHRAAGSVATSAVADGDVCARTAGLRASRDTEFQYANAQRTQSAHTNVWRRFMRPPRTPRAALEPPCKALRQVRIRLARDPLGGKIRIRIRGLTARRRAPTPTRTARPHRPRSPPAWW